jgi:hypothetical protein
MSAIPFGFDSIVAAAISPTYGSATLSNNGRTVALVNNAVAYPTAFSNLGQRGGKKYCEFTIGSPGTSGKMAVGLQEYRTGNGPTSTPGGTNCWLYRTDGKLLVDNTGAQTYGSSYTTGDVIGMAVDNDAQTVTFYKNGVSQGLCTNTTTTSNPTGGNCPCIAQGDLTPTADTMNVTINGGDAAVFAFTPPSTYSAWASISQFDPCQMLASDMPTNYDPLNPLLLLNVIGWQGRTSGQYYFEVEETDAGGVQYWGYVGIISGSARSDITSNIANSHTGTFIGEAGGWGPGNFYGGSAGNTGKVENAGGVPSSGLLSSESTSAPLSGDTFGLAVDMDAKVLYFFRNGLPIPSGDSLPARLSLSAFTDFYPAIGRITALPISWAANFAGPFLVPGGSAPIVNGLQYAPWQAPAPVPLNPSPVIESVTIDNQYHVTNVGNAGPTTISLVNTWWEITLPGDIVVRIAERTNVSFASNHNQTDLWDLPVGAEWQGLSITFNIQATTGGTIYTSAPFVLTDPRFNYGSQLPPGPPPYISPPTLGTPGPGVYRNIQGLRDNSRRGN